MSSPFAIVAPLKHLVFSGSGRGRTPALIFPARKRSAPCKDKLSLGSGVSIGHDHAVVNLFNYPMLTCAIRALLGLKIRSRIV